MTWDCSPLAGVGAGRRGKTKSELGKLIMKHHLLLVRTAVSACLCAAACWVAAAQTEEGFKSVFNGQDLTGWDGLSQFWSVKGGAITGQTTKENPAKRNTFLVWKGGEVGDFELRLAYKLTPDGGKGFANSGVQYRSKVTDPNYFVVAGYQADMEAGKSFSGILYEEGGRGILAQRGQKVVLKPNADNPDKFKIEVTGTLGSSDEIQSRIKQDGWNDYVIIAKGNHLQHFINGHPTVDVTDEQASKAAKSGVMALQLHAGDPMTAQFKNIRIKSLGGQANAQSDLEQVQGRWVPAEMIDNGEKVPESNLAAVKLEIKGNQFTLEHSDGVYRGKFEIKATASPKLMDVTLDDGTEVAAIYEVAGDTVKVCYAPPGSSRPTDFKSSAGSDRVLTVYKRKG
jgi:uncharacterized protein (TIGR03067 family)